ncbi:MAG TPA: hypothetical protein VK066_15930 [Chloroflexota bacterium]|nr:hypothetical protein [Chloroflexota bacterium]
MRRLVLTLLAVASAFAVEPRAGAHADDISENPQCQQLWDQLATPVAMRMMRYVQAADAYPMLPNGRPPVGLYPWAPAVYGAPGFAPPGGGASWQLYRGYLPYGLQQARLTTAFGYPGALNLPTGGSPLSPAYVANQIITNTPGGIPALAPGDLIGLSGLHQAEIANLFTAAGTREAVVGNGLGAADFNLNYASYPMAQAVNYREVLEGLDFYVRNICPRAVPEDSRNGG